KMGVASQDDTQDDALRDARRGPKISRGTPRVSGLGPAPGMPSRSSKSAKRGPAFSLGLNARCVRSAIQPSRAACGTRTDRPIRMTGSSPTASIANTFDRPNPSSLATSPAFSSKGSMAGPPLSALDFLRLIVRAVRQKDRALARWVHVHVLLRRRVASQDDHPSDRPNDLRAVAGSLHLHHYLSICKGPVLAAISADEFRPRLIRFSSSPTLHH